MSGFRPYYNSDNDYNTNANSYYEDLARKNELIKKLAHRIWEYDETLALKFTEIDNLLSERLENWDDRIENLDDEVSDIFVEWLTDGTLQQIINHDVLGGKADKSYVDDLNDEIIRSLYKKANITDIAYLASATPDFVENISEMTDDSKIYVNLNDGYVYMLFNGVWTSTGILYQEMGISNEQVTPVKTSFIRENNPNLFNIETVVENVLDINTGELNQSDNYITTDFIHVESGKTYVVPYLYVIAYYNGNSFISSNSTVGLTEVTIPVNANTVKLSVRKDYIADNMYYLKLKNVKDGLVIDNLLVDGKGINKLSISEDKILDNEISTDKTNFILKGKNLFNKNDVLKNKNIQDGYLSDTANFNVSHFIKGKTGVTYTLDRFRKIATYDVEGYQKRYIDNTTNEKYQLTMQDDEYTFRVSVSNALLDTVMVYQGTEEIAFEPYYLKLHDDIKVSSTNNVYGLKGVAFGDSITHGATYPENVSTNLNTEYTKVGFNGTRLMRNTFDSPQSKVNLCNIVDSIVSGDWSILDAAVDEIGGDFVTTLTTLKSINFNEIDYVTIAYGANDSGTVEAYNALGDIDSDDTYTFNGAINYVITKLLTKYPTLKIHLFTPLYRDTVGYDTKPLANALKTQHEKWHVGLLDIHNKSMFNPLTISYYTTDGTHPNTIGNEVLDKLVNGYLANN